MDNSKVIPVAIIAIALMSIVLYYAFGSQSAPMPSTQAPSNTMQDQTSGNNSMPQGDSGATQNGPVGAPQAEMPSNTKAVSSKEPATIVPDNMQLDDFCKKYYEAWLAKDWKTAYEMIPYAKQQEMDVSSFTQRNEGYGLSSADVGKPAINGNAGAVIAAMNTTQYGTWATTWSFVKNDKGQWTLQDTKSSMAK